MTRTDAYHFMITAINVAILISLIRSFVHHYRSRELNVNFHSKMLLLCTCLLLANTFAFISGIYSYFILDVQWPEIVSLGRFADRYCMWFAYLALEKIDKRYEN